MNTQIFTYIRAPLVPGVIASTLFMACQRDEPTVKTDEMRPPAAAPVVETSTVAGEKCTLRIVDGTSVAWTVLNNTFAEGRVRDETNPSFYKRTPWTGVLFQLGEYWDPVLEEKPRLYTGVQIDQRDGTSKTYSPGTGFTYWFNVLPDPVPPDPSARASEPLALVHVGALFPNNGTDPSLYCRPDPDCTCACTARFARRLHPYLEPKDILTFWQGTPGYTLDVTHAATDHHHNKLEFQLRHKVTVQVYRIVDTTGGLEITEDPESPYTDVVTLTVLSIPPPAQHGNQWDPPMP